MHARALGRKSQPQTHHSQPLTAWPAALLSGTPQAVRACADGAELVTCGRSEFVLIMHCTQTLMQHAVPCAPCACPPLQDCFCPLGSSNRGHPERRAQLYIGELHLTSVLERLVSARCGTGVNMKLPFEYSCPVLHDSTETPDECANVERVSSTC